jgi:hypothetical protein
VDREPSQLMPGSPGDDGDGGLCGVTPDWVDDAEWARICDQIAAGDGDEDLPGADEESWDREPVEEITAEAEADGAEYAAIMARLIAAGLDGYAHHRSEPPIPGVYDGPAPGFAFGQGRPLDDAAPCTVLSGLADEASGGDRLFADVNDDELMGLLGARQRLVARQDWELMTGIAEFIRRRPEPGCKPDLPGRMPKVWDEHAASELAAQLHLTARAASGLLELAHDLAAKLPLTCAALRDGVIDLDKAHLISLYCSPLTLEEAGKVEAILFGLDTIGEMTWGMLRDRVARAVIEVNPDATRKRREQAAKNARVEVIPEFSGNCQIAGRELPAAAALVADQNLTARAEELRRAGVPGGMDELRALAYLEALGAANPLEAIPGTPGTPGTDPGDTGDTPGDGPGGNGGSGPDGPRPASPSGIGMAPGKGPAGFAARVNLTVTLPTLAGLEDRPGVLSRVGPVDPATARDLAAAAARDPRTTWCLTIIGPDHRPIAHGCGRPPRNSEAPPDPADRTDRTDRTARDRADPGSTHDPPLPDAVRLNIAALTGTTGTGIAGDLVFDLENLAGPCDHNHEAKGHDPGVKLRHLTGILNNCCTFPPCRRPHATCDYEHSTPHEQGGRTCLCNAGPVCRHNHRDKQAPGWRLEQAGKRGWFKWTTPSGRTYLSRPTQYPD